MAKRSKKIVEKTIKKETKIMPEESKIEEIEKSEKIERLKKAANVFAFPENMLGITNENGVEVSSFAGLSSVCKDRVFDNSSRFEIFVTKEELIELRSALKNI